MPLSQFNLSWPDQNAVRAYPLAEDATGRDVSRSFVLPNDFLVQIHLAVPQLLCPDLLGVFIREITLQAAYVEMVFAYEGASQISDLAAARVVVAGFSANSVFSIIGNELAAEVTGTLTVHTVTTILRQPHGTWFFAPDDTRVDMHAVWPVATGVLSLSVVSGTTRSERLRGDIELRAGVNMQIVPVVDSGKASLKFSAINGAGLNEICACAGDASQSPCLKTINDVAGYAGNLNLLASGGCLQITPGAAELTLDDTCCKPCCDCPELTAIVADLQILNQERQALIAQVNSVAATVQAATVSMLGARLGTRGCVHCQ